ncbi:MAG: hypothetical protein K2I22_00730 [Lachnospiraceae bacterium]|nr:hypothetical protein [Lachnospiraceae bacterium]
MQMKKRFAQTIAVLFVGLLLYAFGVWESGRQNRFTGEKGKCLYPSRTEALERAAEEPVLCVPVGEVYASEEETGIAEGLLAELQEYVSRGEQSEAMAAYRDEALMLDVEELLKLCPEYESLIEEMAENDHPMGWRGEIPREEDIVGIYRISLSGEDSDTFLVQYNVYFGTYGFWVLLKKTEEEYLARYVWIGTGQEISVKKRGSVIFSWGEGKERGYYLLEKPDNGELYVKRLVLCENWKEEVRGVNAYKIFDGDSRYIRQETARAVPDFYYLNRKSSLLPAVKEYVEENMACFADKLYGWDGIVWRDFTIWGDEESAVLTEEEEQQIEETLGKRIYARRVVVSVDYDNDGDLELFFREEKEGIRLLFWEDGVCKAEPVALHGKETAAQMWFVEFAGKMVTFEIELPYGEKYPLLSAYLIEGEQKTLLLTCQLVYGDTVEVDGYKSIRESSSYQDIYGFCPVVTLAEEYQGFLWESLGPALKEARGEVRVTPVWEELPFSDSFLSFIRECYGGVLAGRANFSQFLEPYEIDMTEDREKFLQSEGIEDEWWASLYGWAYRFTSPNGAEHFLADRDCGGTLGVCTLQLFGVEEKGPQYTELVDHYRGDYSGIVLFEGQVYCIITDYDFGTKKLCGVHILPLNDRGEWEHYYLSLTPDVEHYQLLCLYGGQEAALSDYVESVYVEALSASVERENFTGIGENAAITAELRRSIKNKDIYVFRDTDSYKVIDADNDGEWEVIRTGYYWPSSYHQSFMVEYGMYGYRDGAFVEFDMENILNGYGAYIWAAAGDSFWVDCDLLQLWFEEIDGVTYLFTLDLLSASGDYLLRACVIQDGTAKDVGVWLLHAAMLENIKEAVYVCYSNG